MCETFIASQVEPFACAKKVLNQSRPLRLTSAISKTSAKPRPVVTINIRSLINRYGAPPDDGRGDQQMLDILDCTVNRDSHEGETRQMSNELGGDPLGQTQGGLRQFPKSLNFRLRLTTGKRIRFSARA